MDEKPSLQLVISGTKVIETEDPYSVYMVTVTRNGNPLDTWQVEHRYSDFVDLNSRLEEICPQLGLKLPGRKIFNKLDRDFIAERRKGLQAYLDELVQHPIIMWQRETLSFFNIESGASQVEVDSFRDASFFVRGESGWKFNEKLYRIGSRIRKTYFAVDTQTEKDKLLSYTILGSECMIPHELLKSLFGTIMTGVKHTFLYPTDYATYLPDKGTAVVVRPYYSKGSLRDMMYGSKSPRDVYPRKYAAKVGHKIPDAKIRLWGRQILEALSYLNRKGLPYGHLHSGNVLIVNNVVKLTDYENAILALLPQQAKYLVPNAAAAAPARALSPTPVSPPSSPVNSPRNSSSGVVDGSSTAYATLENATVIQFGALLVEMTTGTELKRNSAGTVESLPACDPDLRSVLESIFRPLSGSLPSIAQLLEVPYFKNVDVGEVQTEFKQNSKIKDLLRRGYDGYEAALLQFIRGGPSPRRRSLHRQESSGGLAKKAMVRNKVGARSSMPDMSGYGAGLPPLAPSGLQTSSSQLSSPATPPASQSSPRPLSAAVSLPAPPPPPAAPSAPPPPPAGGAPPPPPPPAPSSAPPPSSQGRGALLGSISGFNSKNLKKVKTKDTSGPKIK